MLSKAAVKILFVIDIVCCGGYGWLMDSARMNTG